MSKIIKLARSQNQKIRRQARVRSPGESDSSDAGVNAAEGEGESIEIPDDTEDEDSKTNAIAPSGATIMNTKFRNRVSKRSLPKSISNGTVKRQAGRTGRQDRKISPSLNHSAVAATHSQRQHIRRLSPLNNSRESVKEDLASDPSSPRPSQLLQDDEQDASSGDEIYELLDLMTDSDEDDGEVEKLEEAALIEDVAASGDLGFSNFSEGDSMFPHADDVSGYRSVNLDDYSDYFPFSDVGYETSVYDQITREQTAGAEGTVDHALTPKETDVDVAKDPVLDSIAELDPVAYTSLPMKDIISPAFELLRKQTGLCTPSSLKQPLDLSNCMHALSRVVLTC
jgi:hypothetical protein